MQNDFSDPLDNLKMGNTKLVQMKDLIRTRYRYLITEHVLFSFLDHALFHRSVEWKIISQRTVYSQ